MDEKFIPLQALYSFYDEFARGFSAACDAGCSACCTVNVAATSLEVEYMAQALDGAVSAETLERLREAAGGYAPTTTLNRHTWEIVRGDEITKDDGEHTPGVCPLLDPDGLCSVYEIRPFVCRAMSSRSRCEDEGEADMEPFLITVNFALYQVLEHFDSSGGVTGNLSRMLYAMLTNTESLGVDGSEKGTPIRNCPLPGFLIMAEEKPRFRSFLRRLMSYPAGNRELGSWLPEGLSVY